MAGGGGCQAERSLAVTPTWAVAIVCAVFVILSILIEHGIHSLEKWFHKRHKKAMSEAMEKIKSELMLLGFISLLLTFGTKYIADICIPAEAGNNYLPCKKVETTGSDNRRRLLSHAVDEAVRRRVLAGDVAGGNCGSGMIPLISQSGVHQLHIFIFILAVFHVLYSILTMALAHAKMRTLKSWESETSSLEYEFTNDPSRFRFAHQTSFVKRHTGLSRTPGIRWVVAFFRQFFGSISKVDYMTMRRGFINAHLAPNSKFDFHKYIKRSMEDDFKVVVGISIPLWFFAVIFMLANVYSWYTLTWLSFLPLIILVMVGTKLELVIMDMANQIQDRTTVVRGAPVVEPSNKYFWFNRPQWILFLIHFTLFQNAFQMAYFLWICYEFGITSCFHSNLPLIFTRVFLGVALQILCSYITFPLYSLVTQMGSHMKKAIFEEQTAKAIKKWQKAAKDRKKLRKAGGNEGSNSPAAAYSQYNYGLTSGETTPTHGTSPMHLLHKYKSDSNSPAADIESVMTSPRSYQSDTDQLSEIEGSSSHHPAPDQHDAKDRGPHHLEFTFLKPQTEK